ncbi:MAG: hypothetical protein JSR91_17225 [Proteobacteria bacterium]|nr:hypothetical protein [Pseudomonadota bacterium]
MHRLDRAPWREAIVVGDELDLVVFDPAALGIDHVEEEFVRLADLMLKTDAGPL